MVDPGNMIVGATVAGAKVLAEQAQKDAESDKKLIRNAAKGSDELELAGQVYGQRMAVKEAIILQLWRPLARFLGVSKEYFETDFARDLSRKLEHVADEDLITPRASIVSPAMEALGYCLDEPNLKEMYLELLAGASTRGRAEGIHPSFVDVIRHLESEEAKELQAFLNLGTIPCARIKIDHPSGGYSTFCEYVVQWVNNGTNQPVSMPSRMLTWIDNWQRLGLVQATYSQHVHGTTSSSDPYEWVPLRPEYADAENEMKGFGDGSLRGVSFDRGLVRATSFGRAFLQAVGGPYIVISD